MSRCGAWTAAMLTLIVVTAGVFTFWLIVGGLVWRLFGGH